MRTLRTRLDSLRTQAHFAPAHSRWMNVSEQFEPSRAGHAIIMNGFGDCRGVGPGKPPSFEVAWRLTTVDLRIHFERTGGFAGPAMRRTCTVDTDSLPATEAEELRNLVEVADVGRLAPQPSRSVSVRPDAFHYHLTIEVGGRQYTVEVSDTNMPAAFRPLVQWLTKRASAGHS